MNLWFVLSVTSNWGIESKESPKKQYSGKILDFNLDLKNNYSEYKKQTLIQSTRKDSLKGNGTSLITMVFICHNIVFLIWNQLVQCPNKFSMDRLKVSRSNSLNDVLMIGPTVKEDLFATIFRFRLCTIGLSAEVARMNRQFGHIKWKLSSSLVEIWRDQETSYPTYDKIYVWNWIICTTFYSLWSPNRLSSPDWNLKHHVNFNFLKDDFIGGANTIEEARIFIQMLFDVLNEHELVPRKWVLSDSTIVKELNSELPESTDNLQIFSDNYNVEALGTSHKLENDLFSLCNRLWSAQVPHKT